MGDEEPLFVFGLLTVKPEFKLVNVREAVVLY
jgi:hypothetical protein